MLEFKKAECFVATYKHAGDEYAAKVVCFFDEDSGHEPRWRWRLSITGWTMPNVLEWTEEGTARTEGEARAEAQCALEKDIERHERDGSWKGNRRR